ncbi:MAG: serine/threonine-protein kinase [Coriobacteriales bacterium]|nr:serine/threonine-protein kinase [Coriobacteriales bacterium]
MLETSPTTPRSLDESVLLSKPELVLGRYRIMDANSTGGFGTVLTCWDTRLQRRVAIKRMPLAPAAAGAGAASTVAEALTEARTASLLAHPNIVTVFDFEADPNWAYLVMEYVDGLNLSDLLARVEGGTLNGDECAYLISCVADALSFAHENGVLHLDIKPSNIIVDKAGNVKICDFGMATLASATGFGDARGGTVGYMSPEQIRGEMVDERSDVFSLGVVVWQALTGHNPFAAASAEQSLKLIEKGPRSRITTMIPDVQGISEQALLGALAPSASMRTPSVSEFANELTFTLGDISVGADSIRHLLSQTGQSPEDEEAWEGNLPLYFRYPWLAPLITRGTAAVSSGLAGLLFLPSLFTSASTAYIAASVFAGVAAFWPPLGGALVIVAALLALLTTTQSAAAILLPLVLGAVLIAWWAFMGALDHHSTPAVTLPCCFGNPIAGAAWAAAFLTPLSALAAGTVGWLFGRVAMLSVASAFSAADVVAGLVEIATHPSTWIAFGGCAAAAGAGSAVTRIRPSTGFAVTGQITTAALLIASQLLAVRVENAGIWLAPTWDTTGIAVVLCVLVSIATVLSGPEPEDLEDDDYELD